MNIGNWIAIGSLAIVQLSALITAYINVRVKLKELEMEILALQKQTKNDRHSFHIHEQQNEKMFDKFEKKIDDVYDAINDVKNILISKNFN